MSTKQLTISILSLLLLLSLTTSCSKETGEKVRSSQESVKIDNNVLTLSGRITSYVPLLDTKDDQSARQKSGPDFDLSHAIEIKEGFDPNSAAMDASYHLKAGNVLRSNIKMMPRSTFYVSGRLSIPSIWGNGLCKIIVLPGGELTYEQSHIPGGLQLELYGDCSFSSNLVTAPESTVHVYGDFQAENIQVGGILTVEGNLTMDRLTTYQGPVIRFNGCAEVSEGIDLSNNAQLFVGGYLKTNSLNMNSSARLVLNSGSLVQSNRMELQNVDCEVINEGENFAVLDLGRLVIHQNNVKRMFLGWQDLHFKVLENNSGSPVEWLSSVRINGDSYIAPTSCSPGFGTPPPTGTEVLLKHLAELAAPKNNVSATGIAYYGKYAYVSWHTYGDNYGGFIDVLDIPQRQVRLSISTETSDFNHVMVTNTHLWTAGGTKNGAFAARLPLGADGLATVETLEKFLLQGSTGKCLLPVRNAILTASGANGGYQLFDKESLTLQSTRLAENAKYIDKQGSHIVTLTGIENAKISIYREEDVDLNQPVEEFFIGNIDPSKGKNVVRMDGNRIYVAMGFSGVKAFEGGVEVAHYAMDPAIKAAANGLDFDEKYLYVAEGNAGVTILKKSDLSHVLTYRHSNASANFVTKGQDGLIYVAYGTSGVHAFELIERQK